MIGTKVRGSKHLLRLINENGIGVFFMPHPSRICYGKAFLYRNTKNSRKYFDGGKDCILVFNNAISNTPNDPSRDDNERLRSASVEFPGVWAINPYSRGDGNFTQFEGAIVLPETFEKDYHKFLDENKKGVANIARYVDVNCDVAKYIYVLSSGSRNYFFWLINLFFKQSVHITVLEHIMNWCENYGHMSGELKKGTPTAYTRYSDIEMLVNEMYVLRRSKRASNTINTFNTAQKKALKGMELTDSDYDVLSKFGKLSYQKRNNFIRKVSNIEDPREILKLMAFLTDQHFSWNKQSLMDFIKNSENIKCEVVFDNDNIVLVKVFDFDTVKRLAKTTNWCISKNKSYWNEYVVRKGRSTQYVLFDFSRKEDDRFSIIGFTSLHNRGIILAHDFNNTNIMGRCNDSLQGDIVSFIRQYVGNGNIESILKMDGIDLSLVTTFDISNVKWDRDTVIASLNKFVPRKNYYIVSDLGDKMAILTSDTNIFRFIGGDSSKFIDGVSASKILVFIDFSADANSSTKLCFSLIGYRSDSMEEYSMGIFDARSKGIKCSFNSKLDEYGLPYDIISRSCHPKDVFFDCLYSYDSKKCSALINDASVKKVLLSKEESDRLMSVLIAVTLTMHSFDYINLFYNNGYTLKSIMGFDRLRNVFNETISNILSYGGELRVEDIFNEKYISQFESGELLNYSHSCAIGIFKAFSMMVDKELKTADEFSSVYRMLKRPSAIADELMICMAKKACEDKDGNKYILSDMLSYCRVKKFTKALSFLYDVCGNSDAKKNMDSSDGWYTISYSQPSSTIASTIGNITTTTTI